MELHQLRYFARMAECESVSKACEDLHVSQSALSKSLGKLETELGLKLFDRVGKRLVINNNGRQFQQDVNRILEDVDTSVARLTGNPPKPNSF